MMPTELSVLDKAERGDSHGKLVEDSPSHVAGREVHRTVEPTGQPQVSEVRTQDERLDRVSGPEGLARVKDYDRRFAFYPSFSVERSLALEYRAQEISRLSMEIQTLRRNLAPENLTEPSNMYPTDEARERLEGMMSRLTESLVQYDSAWAHAKIVDNAESPEQSTLDELRLWLNQRSTGQAEMYRNKEWHEFRMLASPKGPIEKLVKATMPLSRIGRVLLRPFRSHSIQFDDLQILRYEDADLSWVVGVLLLLGICVFLVLPLALLCYFDTNRNVRMALVLVMCFLISVFARVIEADEARQVVFVCVYSAVMSGFLSQMP